MAVVVLLAAGAEEMEVVIPVDVLRRGGVEVVLAGVAGLEPVEGSRGVILTPDVAMSALTGPFEAVVVPGGNGGVEVLKGSPAVGALLKRHADEGGLVAAICAGGIALAAHGLFGGRAMTGHPSVAATLAAHGAYSEDTVVEDGPLLTSRGAGTSFPFALALLRRLRGPQVEATVRKGLVYPSVG